MDRNELMKELKAGRAVHVPGLGIVTDDGHLPRGSTGEPIRDQDGKLTRRGAELCILAGQTVLLPGAPGGNVPVGNLADLPPESVLAEGNAKRLEAHLDDLDERYQQLLGERNRARQALEKTKQAAEGKTVARAAEVTAPAAPPTAPAVGRRVVQTVGGEPAAPEPPAESPPPAEPTPAPATQPEPATPPDAPEDHDEHRGRRRR